MHVYFYYFKHYNSGYFVSAIDAPFFLFIYETVLLVYWTAHLLNLNEDVHPYNFRPSLPHNLVHYQNASDITY